MKIKDVRIINQTVTFDIRINHCGFDLHSYLMTNNDPICDYAIFAIFSGSGKYILNGKSFKIQAGDVCYIPRGIPYATESDIDAPLKHYYVAFSGSSSSVLIDKMGFSVSIPIISTNGNFVKNKLASIFRLLSKQSFSQTIKANLELFDVFYYFIKLNPANNAVKVETNKYISFIEDYIKQNYTQNITVNSIAKALYINRTYLSHMFSSIKGVSIKQYINACRIEKALVLLQDETMTTATIAQEVGFNDSTTFYRQFTKMNKFSPKQYQQRLKDDKLNRKQTGHHPNPKD